MTEHDDAYQEWLDWLRQRLNREPTPSDIRLAQRYADMAAQRGAFRDEIEQMKAADEAKKR
jgi:hypothetical protein